MLIHARKPPSNNVWLPWNLSGRGSTNFVMALNQDFKEFLQLLAKHSVKFLVVVGRVIQLGSAPIRIDILTPQTGLSFEECWEKRITVEESDVAFPVIGLADLIVNKKALGRHQDLADLKGLDGSSGSE
jgi:hypothetical protein